MPIVGRLDQYGSMLVTSQFDETTANNTSITGLGTYYSSEFSENVGIGTTITANVYNAYDPISDEFAGTSYGPGKGTYMSQNTNKSVIVYNEIDEVSFNAIYTVNPSVASVNEGNSISFNVITTNVDDGTTLYYDISSPIVCNVTPSSTVLNPPGNSITFTINTVNVGIGSTVYYDITTQGTNLTASDFFDRTLSGVATITSGLSTSVTKIITGVSTNIGNKYFTLNVRRNSITGPIIGSSPIILGNSYYTGSIVSSGLILYYDAGTPISYSGSGATWTDLSSAVNTGTLQNSPTFSYDAGGSFIFNGTNNEVTTTTLYTNPQTFSIGAWFKTSSASGKKIIGFESSQTGTGSASYDRQIYVGSDGKLYFGVFDGAAARYATSTFTYNDNNWYYVVGTYGNNGTTMTLYVNGASVATGTASAAQNYNGYWRIAGYRAATWTNASDGYFPGSIGAAHVYNVGLTASQVLQNFNAHRGRFGV
jgi:hypothetical protein